MCEPALGEDRTTCAADCSDFYVRDWTDSAAVHDDGAEPSADPVFYDSSDVWSRTTDAPGAFVSDVPVNEDPVLTPAHNYGFVRVHRNSAAAPGSPSVTVDAEFFRAQAGLGPNFVSLGSTTLSFAAGDTAQTLASGLDWTLPATASGHMCFAVEISAPGDPAQAPGILGGTAGAGMRADNNKAQRNMTVSIVPPPPPAPSPAKKMSMFAVVHNALLYPRTMTVRYAVSAEALEALGEGQVQIVGGAAQRLGRKGALLLPGVMPGENRWVMLTVDVPTGELQKPATVDLVTDADTPAASGFTFVVRQAPLAELRKDNARRHQALLQRLDALGLLTWKPRAAPGKWAAGDRAYRARVRADLPRLEDIALDLVGGNRAWGRFPVAADLIALRKVVVTKDQRAIAILHARVLNGLDALLTARELADGDEADILQTVRWQLSLVPRLALGDEPYVEALQKRCTTFVTAYLARKATIAAYPTLVKDLMPALSELAARVGRRALKEELGRMEANLESPKRLQGAHRRLLLELQALAK